MVERVWKRTYLRELMLSLVVYGVLLVASLHYGIPMKEGALRTALMITPMLGFVLMLAAIIRHLRRIDEYLRQTILENTAAAAAITAGVTFTYGFLENAGFPRLSMFAVWPILASGWMIAALARRWMER